MKKLLVVLVLTLLSLGFGFEAKANTIKVVALEGFSTEFPLSSFNVQALESTALENDFVIPVGTIIAGKVVKIEKPKKFKRNATFEFIPTSLSYKGEIRTIENLDYVAQVIAHRPIDTQNAAIYLARKATNFVFIGASTGIAFVQGLTQAEEGGRAKSGFVSAYKDSPLSYFEVGDELNVGIGDTLILKIKKYRP